MVRITHLTHISRLPSTVSHERKRAPWQPSDDAARVRRRELAGVKGFTLVELLIVMLVTGIVLAIAVPRARAGVDRVVVRSAATDVRATLGLARTLALAGHAVIVVDVDSASGVLRIRRGSDILMRRAVARAHGVELHATRDSMAYDPYGMGRGASNLSVLIRRGVVVETVFVSRMGRIR